MPTLVAVDLVAIQRFVFQSNRLKDAVGASQVVEWATGEDGLVDEVAPGAALVCGGGNAVLEFEDADHATSFSARYTRRLLDNAPGLEVAVAHCGFQSGDLARALLALQVDLARAKTELRGSAALLGLGVTEVCRETGQPAAHVVKDTDGAWVPVSRAVRKARARLDDARRRWAPFLASVSGDLTFPLEFDDLGRTEHKRSLLGVVHVDGNGIGARIVEWLTRHVEDETPDEQVRTQYGEWSDALTKLGKHALQQVVDRVLGALEPHGDGQQITGRVPDLAFSLRQKDNGPTWLPVRPILLGGDDLTFVCDGRLALDLAVEAAEALATTLPHLGEISACAGVAIVPVHTPFVRAYELAEGLCRHAKRTRQHEKWPGGAVDWHVGAVRPGTSVEALRDRNYQGRDGTTLTARPYPLDEGGLSWPWLRDELLGTADAGLRGKYWSERHAKAVQLGRVVRDDKDAVGRALERWRISEPLLALPDPIPDGFDGGRTPLLDAVELLDRAQDLRR